VSVSVCVCQLRLVAAKYKAAPLPTAAIVPKPPGVPTATEPATPVAGGLELRSLTAAPDSAAPTAAAPTTTAPTSSTAAASIPDEDIPLTDFSGLGVGLVSCALCLTLVPSIMRFHNDTPIIGRTNEEQRIGALYVLGAGFQSVMMFMAILRIVLEYSDRFSEMKYALS
jgi:hypothetical protein